MLHIILNLWYFPQRTCNLKVLSKKGDTDKKQELIVDGAKKLELVVTIFSPGLGGVRHFSSFMWLVIFVALLDKLCNKYYD